MNVICAMCTFSHLTTMHTNKVANAKKLKKSVPTFFFGKLSREPNMNEQMCWLCFVWSICHAIMCIDIDGWRDGNLSFVSRVKGFARCDDN